MSITFSPVSGTDFGKFFTTQNINETITATESAGTMVSVDITADLTDSNVSLTNGVNSCTIVGAYQITDFNNTATYIAQGQSDKTQTPITDTFLNTPSYEELFQVTPDPLWTKTITYSVTATSSAGTSSATYTLTLVNDFPEIQTWIKDYFTNKY